jgi:hypothetical protein
MFVDSHGMGCRKTDQIVLNLDIIAKHPNLNDNDSDNSSLSDDQIDANKEKHRKECRERYKSYRAANLKSQELLKRNQRLQREEEEWMQQHRQECESLGIHPINLSHKPKLKKITIVTAVCLWRSIIQ